MTRRSHFPVVQLSKDRRTFRVSHRSFVAVGHLSRGYAYCDHCDNPRINARDIEALVEKEVAK